MNLTAVMAEHALHAATAGKPLTYRVRMCGGAAGVCGLTIDVSSEALYTAADQWLRMGGHVVFLKDRPGVHSYLVDFPRDNPQGEA